MKVGCYSTAWAVTSRTFDFKGALDNWATFSDHISIAVPESDTDDSAGVISAYAKERSYPVTIIRPSFDLSGADPFAYGKTENAALQACEGDLMVQANLDERIRVRRDRLEQLHYVLQTRWDIAAFWVPNMDLYGSDRRCLLPVKKKWTVHRPGLFRGACRQGIKPDGHPNYDVTSTDELLMITGDLAPAAALIQDHSFETLRTYVTEGWPMVYHCGYLSLHDRLSRSVWWSEFWKKATNGDPNKHPLSMEELAAKETVEHGLPLWPPLEPVEEAT